MESQKLCAYNQTRECFLGLDVVAVDILYAELKESDCNARVQLRCGLWMAPFRGNPHDGYTYPVRSGLSGRELPASLR